MRRCMGAFIALVVCPCTVFAAHPLITDDACTQGRGKFQLEVNGQYDSDKERADGVSVKAAGGQAASTLSYGVIENADLILNVPYLWGTVTQDGLSIYDERGVSDASFEVKWRFLEKEGMSVALKPGVSIPTGNDATGLGTGKTGYHVFLIGSKDAAPWAVHANLGYIRNENTTNEKINIWHVSLATTYEAVKDLKLAGNIGVERNADESADSDPAFVIAGAIYSIVENLDIDFGVKYGLTKSETDYSLLAGLTWRI